MTLLFQARGDERNEVQIQLKCAIVGTFVGISTLESWPSQSKAGIQLPAQKWKCCVGKHTARAQGAGVDGEVDLEGSAWLSPVPVREWPLGKQELIVPRSLESYFRSAKFSFAQTNHSESPLKLLVFIVFMSLCHSCFFLCFY